MTKTKKSLAASLLGRIKSEKKSKAARLNGLKGGRPKMIGYCRNCGEPFYKSKTRGSNIPAICPRCKKKCCTICSDVNKTGTCCCSPE